MGWKIVRILAIAGIQSMGRGAGLRVQKWANMQAIGGRLPDWASRSADPLLSSSPVPCEIGTGLGYIEDQTEWTP